MSISPATATDGNITLPVRSGSTGLLSILRERFGFSDWRSPQDQVVDAITNGENVILHAATGFGKSICFQVPALDRFERDGSTAIVITPLIALIEDQAAHLESKGVPVAYIHHDQSQEMIQQQMRKIAEGKASIVYISPERFCSSTFQREALGVESSDPTKISFVVIDESHLPALWGRNFRYAYGAKLGETIRTVIKDPQIVACTATPTADSQNFLSKVIGLKDWRIIQGDLHRPNLSLSVKDRDRNGHLLSSHKQKLKELLALLNNEAADQPTIVYCSTRREVEELHDELYTAGIRAVFYHGERDGSEKLQAQELFMKDEAQVMVCTSAFGTGIDKGNVRYIVHFNTPGSIEQWAQEAGRAGRDGMPATCQIFYSPLDLHTHMHFARQANPKPAHLLQFFKHIWGWVPPEEQNSPVPSVWINMADFLDRKKKGFYAGMNQTALVILQNAGVINIDGWNVRFPIHPTRGTQNPGEINQTLLDALPGDKEFRANRARLHQHLKLLIYAVQEGRRDPSLIPGLMQTHLLSNGLVDRVASLDLKSLVQVDSNIINTVLKVVNESDFRISDLISRLQKHPPISSGDSTIEISEFGRSGLYSIVEHACWLGLLRMQSRGMMTYVSLTPGGMDELSKQSLTELDRELLSPSSSFERLIKRIGHAAEQDPLRAALGNWYEDLSKNVKGHEDLLEKVNQFGTNSFQVLDQEVQGDALVRAFMRKRADAQLELSDRLTFLVYIFPEIIQQNGYELPPFEFDPAIYNPDPALNDITE